MTVLERLDQVITQEMNSWTRGGSFSEIEDEKGIIISDT